MRAAYRACFLMDVVDEAPDYCVLESEQWTLSLVSVSERVAATLVLAVPPRRREGVPIKLAFVTNTIEGLRPTIAEFGGVLDASETQWEFRGRIHGDGVDPEGNVLQLVQTTRQSR
jgi:hypothetical protein